jgi:hypothetical protein
MLDFQFSGVVFSYQIDVRTLIVILVTGLTATGADWLLRDHPALASKSTVHHWILPALTAWTLGVPLYQLPYGPFWWLGLIIGGALLMIVLVAEFIVIDPTDNRYTPATILLSSVSFALYLMLSVSLRNGQVRLFLLVPTIAITMWFVCLRTLNLRLHGQLLPIRTGIAAIIVGQIASTLHYLPFKPISFGLAILGTSYALTSLNVGLAQGKPISRIIAEPTLILLTLWIIALLLN